MKTGRALAGNTGRKCGFIQIHARMSFGLKINLVAKTNIERLIEGHHRQRHQRIGTAKNGLGPELNNRGELGAIDRAITQSPKLTGTAQIQINGLPEIQNLERQTIRHDARSGNAGNVLLGNHCQL